MEETRLADPHTLSLKELTIWQDYVNITSGWVTHI